MSTTLSNLPSLYDDISSVPVNVFVPPASIRSSLITVASPVNTPSPSKSCGLIKPNPLFVDSIPKVPSEDDVETVIGILAYEPKSSVIKSLSVNVITPSTAPPNVTPVIEPVTSASACSSASVFVSVVASTSACGAGVGTASSTASSFSAGASVSASASTDTPKPTSSSVPATVSLTSVSSTTGVSATSVPVTTSSLTSVFTSSLASAFSSLASTFASSVSSLAVAFASVSIATGASSPKPDANAVICVPHIIVTVNPNIANCFALFFILIRPPY